MTELKPCPFCESKEIEIRKSYFHDGKGKCSPQYSAVCKSCYCRTKNCQSEETAGKLWNSRELDNLIKKICSKIEVLPTAEAEVKKTVEGFYNACKELDRSTKLLVLKIIADSINEDVAVAEQGG